MTTRRATADEAVDGYETDGGGALLDRAAILGADDIAYETVAVPEWGGSVRIRGLTGSERDQYDAESFRLGQGKGGDSLADFRVRRVARGIVDEKGARVFSDADLKALGAKNGAVIDRLDDVVARLSGMQTAAVAEARADLKVVPSDGSGTA